MIECAACGLAVLEHDREMREACKARTEAGDTVDRTPPVRPLPNAAPETAIGQAYRDAGRRGLDAARRALRGETDDEE